MRRTIPILAAVLAGCAQTPAGDPVETSVRPGIDVVLDRDSSVLFGARVGLVTNHTGTDAEGRSTIDRLHEDPRVELVALFSPEHGIRGDADAGASIDSEVDQRTGLPVHSLYGETRKPTPEMLEGVDVLAFDIQDVGARQYTYVSTMALAMQAAAENDIPIVVLDRPNPIGGTAVEGNILDPEFSTFVGMYPIASRHGMTVGELARMFNTEFGIGADLHVVPAAGWSRDLYFDATGLPWINPSPNIRRLEAAIHYPGTVFLEGTNISEGRGTDIPFEQAGAPWVDGDSLAAVMNALDLPGVRFDAVTFEVDTTAWKFPGETVHGVRLTVNDRASYRPVRTGLLLIDAVHRMYPERVEWYVSHFDRLVGTDRVRLAIIDGSLPELLDEWDADAARFGRLREEFLLYP